jgi:uncharacterized membrane protein YoaK (UPF0700 family)
MVAPTPGAGAASAKREDRDGPLPWLLLVLTFVTGLVDAVSYLNLGHVFVANMTGNVVFLGFAVVGVRDFSVSASLTALAAFSSAPSQAAAWARGQDNIAAGFWRLLS